MNRRMIYNNNRNLVYKLLSRTGRVWHKAFKEDYAAQIKEKSLLGHIVCPEETQQRILESDILRILESEGVTEIGALYKVSPSKGETFKL